MPNSFTNILIIGATSAMAEHTARQFAKDGTRLRLVGRNSDRLNSLKAHLEAHGANLVETDIADLSDTSNNEAVVRRAIESLGSIDVALLAHGILGNQNSAQKDYHEARHIIENCFLSHVSLLTYLANHMEAKGSGCIAVIGSVAGDRGRKSNYVYGSSKGALDRFLQGLRNRLSSSGVTVCLIKPGFVDTPMTSNLPKNKLFVSPQFAGDRIYWAIRKQKDQVYIPEIWRWLMLIIRLIPELCFKRMNL